MRLDLRDVVTIDVLLEQLLFFAIRDGEVCAARTLSTTREHMPTEGDVVDDTLAMHIQTLLTPLLESNDLADAPEAIKVRIREVLVSLDRNRTRQ